MITVQADENISNDKVNVEAKMNEAEVYQSMGLIAESIAIYEQLLTDRSDLDPEKEKEIQNRLKLLETKNAHLEEQSTEKLSTADMSYIKETLSLDEDVSAILDSAFAFKELGLFSEASLEYEKLFKLGYPVAEIIPELIQCYLKVYSKPEVPRKIAEKVKQEKLGDKEKGEVFFLAGVEMEKSGHKDQAVNLYESAKDCDPENDEIKEKINVITASLSTGSKYDYLLSQKLMNTEQLKQALSMSKKMNKSVEFILIEKHNIKKEDVGKCTISTHNGDKQVYDDVSLEECQNIFGNTIGGKGWEWEPNN